MLPQHRPAVVLLSLGVSALPGEVVGEPDAPRPGERRHGAGARVEAGGVRIHRRVHRWGDGPEPIDVGVSAGDPRRDEAPRREACDSGEEFGNRAIGELRVTRVRGGRGDVYRDRGSALTRAQRGAQVVGIARIEVHLGRRLLSVSARSEVRSISIPKILQSEFHKSEN